MHFKKIMLAALGVMSHLVSAANKTHAGHWKDLARIPLGPRQEHATVALSSTKLAILGGIIPSNGTFVTTSIMEIYDIPTNTWSRAAPVPIKVNHPNAAVVNGKLYLLGGLSDAADGAWRAFADSWVYDPESNSWTALPSIPSGAERGSAAMGVHEGVIYLVGGMRVLVPTSPGGEQDTVSTVSAFDTRSSSWISIPNAAASIPEGRDHAGVSVVGKNLYILGGRYRGQLNYRDTVFVLDLEDLGAGWRTLEAKMPTARGGVASGTVNGRVYIFGGEGNPAPGSHGVFNETEVFDTKTEKWHRLDAMELPRHGGSAVGIGRGVYLPGGGLQQGAGPVDVMDVFFPSTNFCGEVTP